MWPVMRTQYSIAIVSWETEPMLQCASRGTTKSMAPVAVHINHQGDSPLHIPCQQGADSWWNLSGSCPAKPRHADAAEPESRQPSAIQDTPSTSCVGLGAWYVEVVVLEFDSCEKYGISPRVRTIVVTVVIQVSKAPTITERTKSAINVMGFFGSFGYFALHSLAASSR